MSQVSELRSVTERLRRSVGGVALISFVSSLLLLTGPLFMVAIYDHVIPTRSVDTLLALILLALLAYALYGIADSYRARALARAAGSFAEAVSGRVLDAILRRPLVKGPQPDPLRPVRDIDDVRNYVSGPGFAALFDVPWIPVYVAICFDFHVWIGIAVVAGAATLIVLTLLTEVLTRDLGKRASEIAGSRGSVVEMATNNLEVLVAMGMLTPVLRRWVEACDRTVAAGLRLSDRSGALLELSRIFRMILQSAVLALGAFLVINNEASGGVIIASSILSSRALAPVDQVIATWRAMLAARQGWARIENLLREVPPLAAVLALPPPSRILEIE
ncbi:MAG TPA: type I secretion system permease/ATPase, partial [Alphaproteobacteria bacterium]|nr:type I secretion system permease/ATPase [Alphaproteobacteria bacterium]